MGPHFLSVCIATDPSLGSPQPKLKTLLGELETKVAHEWERIGIHLNIEEGELEAIKYNTKFDCKNCLREMLRIWLRRTDPPSWSAIADALELLEHQDIADNLRSNYNC